VKASGTAQALEKEAYEKTLLDMFRRPLNKSPTQKV